MADYVIDPANLDAIADAGPTGRANSRVLGGYVGMGLAELPALPTTIYSLMSKAVQNMPVGAPIVGPAMSILRGTVGDSEGALPGAQSAQETSDSINQNAREWGGKLAGRELQPGLLKDNSTIDKIGTGMNIATNMIPVGGGPIKSGMEAIKNISTGIKAIDSTVPAIAEAASFLSPFVPTSSPKALIAANLGIGGALTIAADLAEHAPNPQVDEQLDLFKKQWDTVEGALDQHAKANTDVATDGIGQAFDASKDHDVATAIEQFKAVNWGDLNDIEAKKQRVIAAGLPNLEDYKGAALAVAAIGATAGMAYAHRAALGAKVTEFIGGKEFSKAAKEDFVSKPNATNLSPQDVFAAQTTDASIPIVRESLKPEEMRARFEKIASAWNVQSTMLHEDGSLANSNVKLARPLTAFVDDMKVLADDPQKLQLFRDAANSLAESDNRVRSWLEKTQPVAVGRKNVGDPTVIGEYTNWLNTQRRGVVQGTATTQAELNAIERQHAFHTLDPATNTVSSFGDLLTTRRTAMADPVVGPLLQEYKDITKKIGLDYRFEKGLITKKELSDLANLHPNYFPVRIEGKHMSPLELSQTGGRLSRGDPIKELFPYIQETVTDVAHNELKRSAIMELRDRARQGDKPARELLGRDDVYSKNHYNADKMVTYRDYQGNARMIEVRDPMYRHSMQAGAGSAALRLNTGALKFFSTPSRVLEQLTTGPVTAFVGSPFALANTAYGSVATLVNRPKGTVAGYIDALVQNATGGKVGFRGDPTFYAQVAAQMLPNVTAVLSKNAASALESTVKNHSWFASAIGPGTADALSKSMSNYYKASMIHELEKRGLHGGATPMVRNTQPTLDDLESALTPAAKASQGWAVTRDFLHDLFGAIGNAPQAAFFKQNQGRMSEGLLTSRVRNVMGDPSKSGLSTSGVGKVATGATIASPWGGVTLQSFSRFAHAIRTNPVGTSAAIFSTVAMPSMLFSNWNASLGPEYVNYQYNVRTPDQVSGSHYVGMLGVPPEEGLEIRIDQLMRPFKVLTDIVYGSQMGLQDGSIFKPENELMRSALQDGMQTRYSLTGDAMNAALGQVLPAVPAAVNLGLAAMGADVQTRSYADPTTKIVNNKAAGATDSTAKYTDAKFFGYDISARMEAMFTNLGGQVGRAILNTIESSQQGTKDGLTAMDKTKDYGDRFMMNLGQSTREVSGLWGHAATISPSQEASSKALQENMEGLKKLDAASQKLRSLSGSGDAMSGAKGREIDSLVGSGPVQFKDQQMYALAFDAQRFLTAYNRMYAGSLKDLYEQRASAMSSEKVPPKEKQQIVNDISGRIVTKNREALSAVQQWKWQTSKAYGRDIDLRKIQLDEPITQFKELLN